MSAGVNEKSCVAQTFSPQNLRHWNCRNHSSGVENGFESLNWNLSYRKARGCPVFRTTVLAGWEWSTHTDSCAPWPQCWGLNLRSPFFLSSLRRVKEVLRCKAFLYKLFKNFSSVYLYIQKDSVEALFIKSSFCCPIVLHSYLVLLKINASKVLPEFIDKWLP